ncbi:MAG: hypothetical protein RI907_3678 [Pseudomonadota bacterium]|jgi:DNA-binding NarL/FixJ family response regulator
MSTAQPHFLIVDDHALYRTGLAMMLASTWPAYPLHQADSLAAGWALLREHAGHPLFVLLDVGLPDGHALDHVAAWRAAAPEATIVLMSSEVDGALLRRARETGAAGFIHKSASLGEVLASIRSAMGGQVAYGTVPYDSLNAAAQAAPASAVAAEADADVADAQLVADPGGFQPTPMQARILHYLGRGTPNKAIARQVGLNEMQVRAEVSWLTEALGASSREEAYRKALDQGWVSA